MKEFRIETQMRSGTHYVASALAQAYHCKPMLFKDGAFTLLTDEKLSEGLYEKVKVQNYGNGVLYVNHYYHELPKIYSAERIKVLYLIGFPYDSFFSDGLVFSSKGYSVQPSARNRRLESYKFTYGSKEWNFLHPYMIKNSSWLEKLIENPGRRVIRYEDFFLNFESTIDSIARYMGTFLSVFPLPEENPQRIYWSKNIRSKIDDKGIKEMTRIFQNSLEHYYPEYKEIIN